MRLHPLVKFQGISRRSLKIIVVKFAMRDIFFDRHRKIKKRFVMCPFKGTRYEMEEKKLTFGEVLSVSKTKSNFFLFLKRVENG